MTHNIGIVWAEYNAQITSKMLEHSKKRARELGLNVSKVLKVPGAFEIPLAAKKLLSQKNIDGVVVLGVVMQGETAHDEVVAHNAARACMDLMLQYNKPLGMGISGPRINLAQADKRAEPFAFRAVEAVAHMLDELKK